MAQRTIAAEHGSDRGRRAAKPSSPTIRDGQHHGTPLDWGRYTLSQRPDDPRAQETLAFLATRA